MLDLIKKLVDFILHSDTHLLEFVGTYGGFSYLAPFLGVRATAYFSNPDGYSARHLLMAQSALASLGGEGLLDARPVSTSPIIH